MKYCQYPDESFQAFKIRVQARLGGKCSAEGCEWFNPDVLEVDHIVPCGISRNMQSTYNAFCEVLRMEHPETKFQLLCANHHKLKTLRDMEAVKEAKESAKYRDF